MNNRWLIRFLVRGIIISFWCGIIFLFLHSSYIMRWLFVYEKKTLNILVWPQVLDKQFLIPFEQQTGVKINVSYFEHNEELLTKLSLTYNHGYDLIMPTDYIVEFMHEKKLIKKIDRTRLDFWHHLYPALLGHNFDPHNMYTVPFFWSIVGLGINRAYFGSTPFTPSWALIFDENITPRHVSVVDDARELSAIAAQYLFGRTTNLNRDQIHQIKRLLFKQKEWVELYTDNRAEYVLASGSCPVVVAYSADLAKVLRRFDTLQFIIPREGGFVLIDSFAIAASSKKDDIIYQFLNYLYRPEVLGEYVEKFEFFSPIKNITVESELSHLSVPTVAMFKKTSFF